MPVYHPKSEPEWLALREAHIGGSEIAALFYLWRARDGTPLVLHMMQSPPENAVLEGCLSPYTTGYRLLLEKRGDVPPDAFAENERVQAGLHLEPALAAWAKHKWDGWPLRKVHRYLEHGSHPWWGASLDYEIHQRGKRGTPVEFKNVDRGIFYRDWSTEDDEIASVPLHINLQLQHQIGAAASTEGWVVACVGGNTLMRGRIPRHDPTQAMIAEAVTAFELAVKHRLEPPVTDYEAVAELFAHGEREKAIDLSGDDKADMLGRMYRRWKAHEDRVGKHLSWIKGRVASKLGDAGRATSQDFNFTWAVSHRAAKLIPARWQDEKSYRGALYVTPKKGNRNEQ